MILGKVNARSEAVVRLRVRGPKGIESALDIVVDSGFSSSLTLPAATVTALGLVKHSSGNAILADGTVCRYEIYAAEVEWDGTWRTVLAYGLGGEPLLGMRLLAGYEFRMEVKTGGPVQITALP